MAKRIMTIVGARPQFIKAAMLSKALADAGLEEILIHTGQHYDDAMSGVFFRQLGLPIPERNLGAGSGRHGEQTARMLVGLEQAMVDLNPDIVVVFGDTNSTLAGALSAAKLKIPIAHVEAGMRNGERHMPEEINRVITDHLSDMNFAPTKGAVDNLLREGIESDKISLVGDIMAEAASAFAPICIESYLNRYEVARDKYIYATLHRAENTDNLDRLRSIITSLDEFAGELPVVFICHPRTLERMNVLQWHPRNLTIHSPVDYLTSLALSKGARVVITDSGGVQKESAVLGTPVIVLRESTEWRELVDCELVKLVDPVDLKRNVMSLFKDNRAKSGLYLDLNQGRVSQAIVQKLIDWSEH